MIAVIAIISSTLAPLDKSFTGFLRPCNIGPTALSQKLIAKGNCEKIGLAGSSITVKVNGKAKTTEVNLPNHEEAIKQVFKTCISFNRTIATFMLSHF